MQASSILWNPSVKLILSDVDETIADNYTSATPKMIHELIKLLRDGIALFLISGSGLPRIRQRIIDAIPPTLRYKIVVAHCSGAEVWGFAPDGKLRVHPFYSVYDTNVTDKQKKLWRELTNQLIQEFKLKVFSPTTAQEFKAQAGDDPLSIIMEDRGPQITFEVINGYDLTPEQEQALEISVPQTHGSYDLRIPILERAQQLFAQAHLPITPRLGGMWALDFAIKGVNKTTAVKNFLADTSALTLLNLSPEDVQEPSNMEIWGDRFSTIRGGTDRHICEAVAPTVRAIDFREEDPAEFPKGYNIVLWKEKNTCRKDSWNTYNHGMCKPTPGWVVYTPEV